MQCFSRSLVAVLTIAPLLAWFANDRALAQVTAAGDGTGTRVTRHGDRFDIDGGTLSRDGRNLFHSFEQLGLSREQVANFIANPQLQNILGRVTGGDVSVINGLIQVTGGNANLYLLNPAGIVFGADAQLNVPAAFTATTADGIGFAEGWLSAIGSNNYATLVGAPNRFVFTGLEPGVIVNAGSLSVNAGQSLTLLGGTVINTGTLSAPEGQITIAAVPGANLVRLSQPGMLLSLEFTPIASDSSNAVRPLSLPELLTGGTLASATGLTVNPDGTVQLSGVQIPTQAGTAIAAGQMDTAGQQGGQIGVFGSQVGVLGGVLNVSGVNGGGTILIGGDYQGSGTVPNADRTSVSADAVLLADALQQGDGGRVILWADDTTYFAGNISAQGGAIAGDGGFVEVSGLDTLVFRGAVDTAAANGLIGTLLLDPDNIVIANGTGAADDGQISDGTIFIGEGAGTTFTISEFSLENTTSNIFLEARNNITIQNLTDNVLTLLGGSSVTFSAGGAFAMDAGDRLQTNGRSLTIVTGGTIALGGVTTLGGAIRLDAPGDITVTGGLDTASTADGGDITISTSSGAIDIVGSLDTAGVNNGGTISLSALGNITTQNLSTAAQVGNAGSVTFASQAGSISTSGNDLTTLSAGGTNGNVTLLANNDIAVGSAATGSLIAEAPGTISFSVLSSSGDILLGSSTTPAANLLLPNSIALSGSNLQLFLDSGSYTLISDIDTNGGNFSLSNTGALSLTGAIATAGGEIRIQGSRLTASAPIDAGGTRTASGGEINLLATGGSIATNTLSSIGSTTNGGISLIATEDITTNEISGASLTVAAPGVLDFSAGLSLAGGVSLGTQAMPASNILLPASLTSRGDISLFLNDDYTLAASVDTNGGNFRLDTSGALTLLRSIVTNGGNLTVQGSDIEAQTLNSSSVSGQGGAINLTAATGAIATGDLNSSGDSGGNITLVAQDSITTGAIDASGSSGDGGNVSLDPTGDIEVRSINAQGGSNGRGGNVDITTNSDFRATDRFAALNGVSASISTIGGQGNGTIAIRQGGEVFRVGDASDSGTAAAITTGDATLEAQSIEQDYTSDDNSITITVSGDIPDDGDPDDGDPDDGDPDDGDPDDGDLPDDIDEQADLYDESEADLYDDSEGYDGSFQGVDDSGNASFEEFDDFEDNFTGDFADYLDLPEGSIATLTNAADTLNQVAIATDVKPALVYMYFVPTNASSASAGQLLRRDDDQLELLLVTGSGEPIRYPIAGATRGRVRQVADQFFSEVTNPRKLNTTSYLAPAQQLYRWLIAPMEADLQQQEIGNLAFILDAGLRSLPLAALHDGHQFLVEKHSIGLMPSLSLTDTRYQDIRYDQVLAMGASQFSDQPALPAVPIELATITQQLWSGQTFLNEAFTLANLRAQRDRQPYGIVHLATHGQFRSGSPRDSYIQFWDQKLRLDQMRQLGLNDPPVDLLVLSACRTALGDEQAELGFAGFAVQAGVKTAMASLWYVSDAGTLGFMAEFYRQLHVAPIKAEALRQTQIAMINGQVRLEGGTLRGSRGGEVTLPLTFAEGGDRLLSHPFYWAAFTMIGSPW
jgi:filamentous hemagglutinin family protein